MTAVGPRISWARSQAHVNNQRLVCVTTGACDQPVMGQSPVGIDILHGP